MSLLTSILAFASPILHISERKREVNMKASRVKKIYVAEYNGNFKIGVSNNVATRLGQLACGCPTIKLIYKSDFLSNAFELEVILHNLYKDKNLGGEWFSDVDIEEIKKIIEKHGNVADYEECGKEENERISTALLTTFNKFFIISKTDYAEDDRDMSVEELRYENEQISKFSIAVSGADVPNIYSDLIYDILFGKDTKQLVKEYKTSEFESFRKYLTMEQNDIIRKYNCIIGDMINSYWTFDKIKDYMEML